MWIPKVGEVGRVLVEVEDRNQSGVEHRREEVLMLEEKTGLLRKKVNEVKGCTFLTFNPIDCL